MKEAHVSPGLIDVGDSKVLTLLMQPAKDEILPETHTKQKEVWPCNELPFLNCYKQT